MLKLKICGLRHPENIVQIAALNPDYMGFIFYKKSPRYVGEGFIMPEIDKNIKRVGVFVNEDIHEVKRVIDLYQLNLIQLHGTESEAFCAELRKDVELIKVFSIKDRILNEEVKKYEDICDYFLFDTAAAAFGGTGKKFDWSVLVELNSIKPWFLSGGISEKDASGIKSLKLSMLHAIDINSRFEIESGLKDLEKIKVFQNELSI